MAEYIDKKYLDRKFQIDMMCLRGGTIFDTKRIIDALPTTDAIERSKIDGAIEEMKRIISDTEYFYTSEGVKLALAILERNIEGKYDN